MIPEPFDIDMLRKFPEWLRGGHRKDRVRYPVRWYKKFWAWFRHVVLRRPRRFGAWKGKVHFDPDNWELDKEYIDRYF